MLSTTEILRSIPTLTDSSKSWLHLVSSECQLVADLAFADVILWVKQADGNYISASHSRPSTTPTIYQHDMVGKIVEGERAVLFDAVKSSGKVSPDVGEPTAISRDLVPIFHDGEVLAVLSLESNISHDHVHSPMESAYLAASEDLCEMFTKGDFPSPSNPTGAKRGAPRVSDGMLRLDVDGRVLYVSPNAESALRRIGVQGEIADTLLAQSVTEIIEEYSSVEETLPVVVMGRAAWRTEIEVRSVVLSLRAIPIMRQGQRTGAILLCRDVSEVRRNERELMSKDATIREIHHRVKNNLQTVSALLRMQWRRNDNPEVRAALGEAMRRINVISMVHETLSRTADENVNFDETIHRIVVMSNDLASPKARVNIRTHGSFGAVESRFATSLAVILTELIANALEHGLQDDSGNVDIRASRANGVLNVVVSDDGVGIAPGRELTGLGSQIVKTLVTGDLGGSIMWKRPERGGTDVELMISIES